MLLNKEKDSGVKFNPWVSANRPSNNWALFSTLVYLVLVPKSPKTSYPYSHAVNIVVQQVQVYYRKIPKIRPTMYKPLQI